MRMPYGWMGPIDAVQQTGDWLRDRVAVSRDQLAEDALYLLGAIAVLAVVTRLGAFG